LCHLSRQCRNFSLPRFRLRINIIEKPSGATTFVVIYHSMKIGIVGARQSGSYAGLLLRRIGHEVLLFDPTTDSEKPCGGGVTGKAHRTMSWLREHTLPHNRVDKVRLTTKDGFASQIPLRDPLFVYSRKTLDSSLRNAAVEAGAKFIPERAIRLQRNNGDWVVSTPSSEYEVNFLIGADGAASSVRRVTAGNFASADLSLALGYYLPGLFHPDTVIASFQEGGFPGYLWSFPRVDHSSIGILCWLPVTNAAELRRRVEQYIEDHYSGAISERHFYAARIPCLSPQTLLCQKVCGKNWALLGDAAGFADAITAEGIYFALRSAELLSGCLEKGEPQDYERAWRKDFGADLRKAAEWRDRFYGGTLLFRSFTRRAVQLIRSSPTVQRLSDTLISGYRSYQELHRQLILQSPRILLETFRHKLLG
jgi:flavin-dependent dehydrogenase